MSLPNFCGIGVPRAGTTWLHDLLSSHPQVYMPSGRKELHFFDWHYERGVTWYEKHFPPDAEAGQYRAIGEFTPHYLYDPQCPARISGFASISRLLLILRNPVERAYSHYAMRSNVENFSGSFESFVKLHPEMIQWGYYSPGLTEYLRWFPRESILMLVFEHAISDPTSTQSSLGTFLGIDPDQFPAQTGPTAVNRSFVAKARPLYSWLAKANWRMRERDQDWLIRIAKRVPLKRLFARSAPFPRMTEETRSMLQETYRDEIDQLESLLGLDLNVWR